MKKKILSVLLCVMLVLPFAVCAVADSDDYSIGTINDNDSTLSLIVTKRPEITVIPGSDYFKVYGIFSSAIEIHADLVGGEKNPFFRFKELFEQRKDDLFYVKLKLADESEGFNIKEVLENITAHDDVVSYVENWSIGFDAWTLGDANGNGYLDAIDYSIIKRYCLGTYIFSDFDLSRIDINRDGVVNVWDYAMVKRKVLGTYDLEKVDNLFDHAD